MAMTKDDLRKRSTPTGRCDARIRFFFPKGAPISLYRSVTHSFLHTLTHTLTRRRFHRTLRESGGSLFSRPRFRYGSNASLRCTRTTRRVSSTFYTDEHRGALMTEPPWNTQKHTNSGGIHTNTRAHTTPTHTHTKYVCVCIICCKDNGRRRVERAQRV